MPEVQLGLKGSLADCFSNELCAVKRHVRLIQSFGKNLINYAAQAQKAYEKNEFLDIDLARGMIACGAAFLKLCEEEGAEVTRTEFLLAAVSYLLNDDDDQPDFESVIGLEDDAEVFQSVISAFQLEQKLLEIDPKLESFFKHPAMANKGEAK